MYEGESRQVWRNNYISIYATVSRHHKCLLLYNVSLYEELNNSKQISLAIPVHDDLNVQ